MKGSRLLAAVFTFGLAVSAPSGAAQGTAGIEKAVSDEQALFEAKANRQLANAYWDQNLNACASRDTYKLFAIMKDLNDLRRDQPTNHLKYRARFVYSSCQAMLSDVSFFNGACLNRFPSAHDREYLARKWAADTKACDEQIENPDLSYDDPEPTEAELAEQFRKEGKTEEEIAFIMKLRKL